MTITATTTWVDAGPFRAHLRHLMRVGDLTADEVAALAGVSPRLADSLLHGRNGRPLRRISPGTARALLDLTPSLTRGLRSRQVPAADARTRLRRLLAAGSGLAQIAEELGVAESALVALDRGTDGWCSGLLALRLVVATRVQAAGPVAPAQVAA